MPPETSAPPGLWVEFRFLPEHTVAPAPEVTGEVERLVLALGARMSRAQKDSSAEDMATFAKVALSGAGAIEEGLTRLRRVWDRSSGARANPRRINESGR